MTPTEFIAAVLAYDGPPASLSRSFPVAMTSADLNELVAQHPLRMLNVCDNAGFAKRVAVARAAKLKAAIVAPNIPGFSRTDTSPRTLTPSTMIYIDGDVFTIVEQQVFGLWCTPPGDLVIPDVVLDRAMAPHEQVAHLNNVSAVVALSMYADVPYALGGRLVAGSLGLKKRGGPHPPALGSNRDGPFWVLGDPSYTTAAQFDQDCHVWCEDQNGGVWDVYTVLMGMLVKHHKLEISLPDQVVLLRGHPKERMKKLGLYYRPAPDHLQRAILNTQLEQCAQRLAKMPPSTAEVTLTRVVLSD